MDSIYKDIPYFRNYQINKEGKVRKIRFEAMNYSKKPYMVKATDGRVVITNNHGRTTRSVKRLLDEVWSEK